VLNPDDKERHATKVAPDSNVSSLQRAQKQLQTTTIPWIIVAFDGRSKNEVVLCRI
jgi:hypothetical protein